MIRKDGKWQLDSASGRLEILARRIGRNELNAMEVCRGYAEAQLEYAAAERDGDRVLKYAQKIVSTPGKQDGLYADGVPDGLVSQAFAGAAAANPAAGKRPEPYHGYYFRVLKSQGPDAAGGAFDYVVRAASGRLARGVRRVRNPDPSHQSRGSGLRKGSGGHDGHPSPSDDGVQSRQILGAGGPRVSQSVWATSCCICCHEHNDSRNQHDNSTRPPKPAKQGPVPVLAHHVGPAGEQHHKDE